MTATEITKAAEQIADAILTTGIGKGTRVVIMKKTKGLGLDGLKYNEHDIGGRNKASPVFEITAVLEQISNPK